MIDKIILNGVDYPVAGGGGAGVPTEVRQAMKTLFTKAAYIETGLADEVAVITAWAESTTSITVSPSTASVSNASPTAQLSAVTTPAGGGVTWASSNTAVATVSSTGLVTAIGNGTCTITATSGTMSASCAVTVTGFATLTGIEAVYTQSGTVYDTASLDDLKADLVVTASYDDSSTAVVTDYTLSGTLAEGTSTITVSYGGFTDTFNVTVTEYVEEYSFFTSVANWNYGSTMNFTSRTTDGFVANSADDSSWSAWTYQNGMVVTTDAVDGKTIRIRFDLELDNYSSGQGFIVGVAAWQSTNPTTGVQRDGYESRIITESGSYDITIPIADTNLAISSSRYLGFYANIHMNSSATVTLTDLKLTYY